MKYIVAFVAIFHVVLSQDTSTTPVPAFRDTNVNGVNAGNMNGVANPGNMNPGMNMNPGNMNPGNVDGMGVNNYPGAIGGGGNYGSSTTVIPGAGINAAGQVAGITAGGSVLGGGDSSSSEETGSELDLPDAGSIGGGGAMEEGDSPDTPDAVDGGAAVNANANANAGNNFYGGNNFGTRGDNDFNEIGDVPDNAENMVDADMGEQVGATSTGATAGILVGVLAVVAAGAGVGLYVVKQRRNVFSSSNV